MEAVLDVEKKYKEKKKIKRLELEYDNTNYIIFNLEEKVIDVNGSIYMVDVTDEDMKNIEDMIWEYSVLDDADYWPDKFGDSPPMATLWRISFYDETEVYYHKSGATKYPSRFLELVKKLNSIEKKK